MDCGLTGLTFTRPSLVKPHFAADCDISNIVRKFIRTGELPRFQQKPNLVSDQNYPSNFQDLQDRVVFAKTKFEELSPDERAKYNNSAEVWINAQLDKFDEVQDQHDNPAAGNPAAGNPAAGNPAAGNPAAGNPAAGNPAAGNPAA